MFSGQRSTGVDFVNRTRRLDTMECCRWIPWMHPLVGTEREPVLGPLQRPQPTGSATPEPGQAPENTAYRQAAQSLSVRGTALLQT